MGPGFQTTRRDLRSKEAVQGSKAYHSCSQVFRGVKAASLTETARHRLPSSGACTFLWTRQHSSTSLHTVRATTGPRSSWLTLRVPLQRSRCWKRAAETMSDYSTKY